MLVGSYVSTLHTSIDKPSGDCQERHLSNNLAFPVHSMMGGIRIMPTSIFKQPHIAIVCPSPGDVLDALLVRDLLSYWPERGCLSQPVCLQAMLQDILKCTAKMLGPHTVLYGPCILAPRGLVSKLELDLESGRAEVAIRLPGLLDGAIPL